MSVDGFVWDNHIYKELAWQVNWVLPIDFLSIGKETFVLGIFEIFLLKKYECIEIILEC